MGRASSPPPPPPDLRDKPDVTEIIDIFTCEDIISSHVRISYRFYQFVTTRYSTDFYVINNDTMLLSNQLPLKSAWGLRYIVYVIESAAYGVLFTSCLCQNPNERGTSE